MTVALALHVITGGPGSGKTSLIDILATQGLRHILEASRAIIQDQLAAERARRVGQERQQARELSQVAERFRTLSGLAPYEYIAKIWTSETDRFIVNPIHQMPGLDT